MLSRVKKAGPAVAALGAGAFMGAVAIVLGGVLYTGEGFGSERQPPEQIYFNF
ncbi:MAG: hypothetical protein AAFY97_07670 [Pseudomonadota bacterium]